MHTTDIRRHLVHTIVADHHAILAVFDELQERTGDPRRRRELTDHVITELVRHFVGEEMFLFPTVRNVMTDGERLAQEGLEEHARAEQAMKRLEDLDPTTPEFEEILDELMRDVRGHMEKEELLLPKFERGCDRMLLYDLGERFDVAKRIAPTRPHPSAPREPPGNLVVAPGAGLIDRVRDALTGRRK